MENPIENSNIEIDPKKFFSDMKEKIKKYQWAIIIVLAVGSFFYWFEWRPIQIKKECYVKSGGGDAQYKSCIRANGLEK